QSRIGAEALREERGVSADPPRQPPVGFRADHHLRGPGHHQLHAVFLLQQHFQQAEAVLRAGSTGDRKRDVLRLHVQAPRRLNSASCRPPKLPLLMMTMASPGRACAAIASTRPSMLSRTSASPLTFSATDCNGQSMYDGWKKNARSAAAKASASWSRCTPSFMVFERGSNTATMRPWCRPRKPSS